MRTELFLIFFFLMIRRPPRSTLDRSSAASDVYKRQDPDGRNAGLGRGAAGDQVRRNDPLHSVSWGRAEAVSYTHLRAHETVLDLVCRLLLEKKKPNANDTKVRGLKKHKRDALSE